ncbi:MAG: hypothetical protein KBF54_13050 [Rhizobiales bacterium]|nr:hypothetical protein [Hyphomicrobiales bacterium]MBP9175472.1 hypothetical protein [Hyphomicrobiales bacterium]
MNDRLVYPAFGSFLEALVASGVETKTARRFWGGVTKEGDIVVTTWTDTNDGKGQFYIYKPRTNHGGLKVAWELGNMRVGTEVSVILLRQRGNVPEGEGSRTVAGAALLPWKWKIVRLVSDKNWNALIAPA